MFCAVFHGPNAVSTTFGAVLLVSFGSTPRYLDPPLGPSSPRQHFQQRDPHIRRSRESNVAEGGVLSARRVRRALLGTRLAEWSHGSLEGVASYRDVLPGVHRLLGGR